MNEMLRLATVIAIPSVVCLSVCLGCWCTLLSQSIERTSLQYFAPQCSLTIWLGCKETTRKYSQSFSSGGVTYKEYKNFSIQCYSWFIRLSGI